ncbi:arylsulfatase [Paenibacillus swuensis]|uniref:Arylsulfatase n=1 Tax=Paenibacillus swuensis TaxID=1178515 RepID=A0A172TJ04_9BACL|nr:arylsulfatase [Paenibacillus swuensis]ANE46952.1 arylsulfatase [Paenibacillus swuensis]
MSKQQPRRGKSNPANTQQFQGVIGRTVEDSVADWSGISRAEKDSPNVVFIVLDDTGFAHLGCYGSTITTSNLDDLAAKGLRYTNFHTNSMCSPTRASLLTGRNSHTAGVSMITEFQNGFPNARGKISKQTGTLAEILKEQGYNTIAVGKWHLVPGEEQTFAGPFDGWPTGKGFEHYYGFLKGETDQYNPELVSYHTTVKPGKSAAEGYHLTEDLTDRAIDFVRNQKAAAPHNPFFLYLAYGATHAPHQAPKAYIDKYKGKFNQGWDAIREEWFSRQKSQGVIPQNTELPARNPLVKPWSELGEEEKTLFARAQEVFAGYLEHTDDQIGRLTAYLKEIDQFDNTIIVLISDNGASPEGGQNGTLNEYKHFNGLPSDPREDIKRIDELGTETVYNHYPLGWAHAGNTPLKWYKTWVHAGGVKDPLIISYPNGIRDGGGVRNQYHHVTDIVPTVLELLNLEAPASLGGVTQKPIQGVSLAYSFDNPTAKSRKQTQYYEMLGHRAIWHDGWKAVTNHVPGSSFESDRWELYHEAEDYSESRDLSALYPDKLRELIERWWAEAGKYEVLPIDGRTMMERAFDSNLNRPLSPQAQEDGKGNITFRFKPSNLQLHAMQAPFVSNRAHRITAEVERADPDERGVLVADGNRFGGYALFVQDNRLVYHYNWLGEAHYTITSEAILPLGSVTVEAEFTPTGAHEGTITLYVQGAAAGQGEIRTAQLKGPGVFAVGTNVLSPVSPAYSGEFPYSGVLKEVRIQYRVQHTDAAELLELELASE